MAPLGREKNGKIERIFTGKKEPAYRGGKKKKTSPRERSVEETRMRRKTR